MSRPAFAAALLAAALLLAPLSAQQQQTPAPAEKFEEMTKAQAESYRRGIDWLVKSQAEEEADGEQGRFFRRNKLVGTPSNLRVAGGRPPACGGKPNTSKRMAPSAIVAAPIVCSGWRRRSVGLPGLKI